MANTPSGYQTLLLYYEITHSIEARQLSSKAEDLALYKAPNVLHFKNVFTGEGGYHCSWHYQLAFCLLFQTFPFFPT